MVPSQPSRPFIGHGLDSEQNKLDQPDSDRLWRLGPKNRSASSQLEALTQYQTRASGSRRKGRPIRMNRDIEQPQHGHARKPLPATPRGPLRPRPPAASDSDAAAGPAPAGRRHGEREPVMSTKNRSGSRGGEARPTKMRAILGL